MVLAREVLEGSWGEGRGFARVHHGAQFGCQGKDGISLNYFRRAIEFADTMPSPQASPFIKEAMEALDDDEDMDSDDD